MSWSTSLLWWALPALLLFWAVGAYNRMVRLRAAALHAFSAVELLLRQHAELVERCLPASLEPAGTPQSVVPTGDSMDVWRRLRAAAAQHSASLAAVKSRPLVPSTTAALAAAHGVLDMAWDQMRQDAHDLAGAPLPEALLAEWQLLGVHTLAATEAFNQAVAAYNAAIAQFPAMLIASLYRLRPARSL